MKELYKAVDEEIRKEAREEAKEILRLTTDWHRKDFLEYHKKDQGNICCLVLDRAKMYLVMEDKMTQNNEDHFGHPLFEDDDTIKNKT